jgi:hypothetical protein
LGRLEDGGKRHQDILIIAFHAAGAIGRPRSLLLINQRQSGGFMHRCVACLLAVLFVAGQFQTASAQIPAQPSKVRLTIEKLTEMRAKWSANKPKLKACRQDVKAKGLSGDDRWFYIEDCMNKV